MAIQEGNNHRVPVRRVAVYQQGTYRGEPILNLAMIPDDGPIPSPEEFNDWANRQLSRRNADAAANAAKRTERDSRRQIEQLHVDRFDHPEFACEPSG
jgi:hypothetical protein